MSTPRRLMAACALVLFSSAAALCADVLYVNAAATGANDGSSWTDAYTDLQAALGAALASDEIWVAAATYKSTATTDRAISFALKNDVGVYGGFDGTETLRGQRDPSANVTVLSGDIGAVGNASDNSYHVVTTDVSVTLSGVLDGFTITGGQANGVDPDNRGGGMWINSGSPTLANLKFTANFASFEGGGLRVTSGAPNLTNCSFFSNSVNSPGTGGGMKSGGGSNVVCTNCVFRFNSVSGAFVGSAGIESAGGLTLVNCVVAQNNPSGAHFNQGDNNTLENCTFANNTAYGIGLFLSNSNAMTNTIVWGNGTAGIFNDGSSSITISYSDLQEGAIGTGNISANPAFLAPPGDLRPGPGSPVVDAGNNAAVPVGVTTDVAGLPRFFNDPAVVDTGAGTPPIVDMGAHERVPLSVSAPSGLDLCAGADAEFSVTAQGQPTITYQWRKDGTPLANGGRISGADTDTLTITGTIPADTGSYDVVVTDGVGQSLTSTAAALTVATAPPQPTITAPLSVPVGSTGNSASVVNNPGSIWNWALSGGAITGGQGTNQIAFDAGPPGTTMLGSVTETAGGCSSPVATATIQVDFLDVPPADPFHAFVISVARAGITAGCGGGNYCRNSPVTRAQMAVFLLKAEHGSSYSPPACQSVFSDVPCPSTFANWIEQLAAEGITGGCGPGVYCPNDPVTRQQMAVFLLKTEHGSAYTPPGCQSVFGDVLCPSLFADWIERLYAENITGGCSTSPLLYCPTNPNTRGQMAVFLVKTFNLP
ncbi:MAG: right-handed parallel beta-helix repeat-containing protein [Thermoanaerobaculia bacterium]